jgi:hypothetical protein
MNQAQGYVKLYLLKNTEMDEEEFQRMFQKDNIVGTKPLEITFSNGKVHKFDVMDVLKMMWEHFEVEEEETEEKSPSSELDDQIAI